MEVYLAGYNVDTDVLSELNKNGNEREDITPEVLSAAYARISRDPRPINELRIASRNEVERARRSNSSSASAQCKATAFSLFTMP